MWMAEAGKQRKLKEQAASSTSTTCPMVTASIPPSAPPPYEETKEASKLYPEMPEEKCTPILTMAPVTFGPPQQVRLKGTFKGLLQPVEGEEDEDDDDLRPDGSEGGRPEDIQGDDRRKQERQSQTHPLQDSRQDSKTSSYGASRRTDEERGPEEPAAAGYRTLRAQKQRQQDKDERRSRSQAQDARPKEARRSRQKKKRSSSRSQSSSSSSSRNSSSDSDSQGPVLVNVAGQLLIAGKNTHVSSYEVQAIITQAAAIQQPQQQVTQQQMQLQQPHPVQLQQPQQPVQIFMQNPGQQQSSWRGGAGRYMPGQFATRGRPFQRGRGQPFMTRPKKSPGCWGCGQIGHMRTECPTNPWGNYVPQAPLRDQWAPPQQRGYQQGPGWTPRQWDRAAEWTPAQQGPQAQNSQTQAPFQPHPQQWR